jgi:hypothetical protein
VIGGNGQCGVEVDSNATQTQITDNKIGINATGTGASAIPGLPKNG